ncbi:hypothetical protein [Jannaschia seohaensis]|uniref:Uncharacterized protein n=1 Tax=Jannaschia seohaensis TaxID=475081 RepID=A0A2Y9B8Z5_9RHOB|nr:hypothetical protein [Jannaschia seohaensis]PWJ11176.1 hypothetical protein BCF38_12020 [Jannaschia seohaensis]SSA51477.1 hypothetical protein SAMN05421539_12020 [Jannaschia seohaensis]
MRGWGKTLRWGRIGTEIPEAAWEAGLAAAQAVRDPRFEDGSNAEDDDADTTGCAPVNPDDGEALVDPTQWTPLRVAHGGG